jgi:hypothetical protein
MTENKPIIRVFFGKMKEAFYNLSEEEQFEFMRKDRENWEELGMKLTTMIDCSWSNEEWDVIGVEEWPTIEALEKRVKFEKEEIQLFRYVEKKTYLGTLESFAEYGKE